MAGLPSNFALPFFGFDFDGSAANTSGAEPVSLYIIGQLLPTGTVTQGVPKIVTSADEAATYMGRGSQAHAMTKKALMNSGFSKTIVVGLDDAATSTAATYSLAHSGTATRSGTLSLSVNGTKYQAGVPTDTTSDAAVAALLSVIGEDQDKRFTAGDATGTITLTALNKGIAAGDFDVRWNPDDGDATPTGITVGPAVRIDGTVDPDIADAIAGFVNEDARVLVQPYLDADNMTTMQTHLATTSSALEQRTGVCYQGHRGTRSELITYGEDVANHNSEFMVTVPTYMRREASDEFAAAVAGATAASVQESPPVPLHRMPITGVKPLDVQDRWSALERNQLLTAGISTLTDELGVQTEATCTMYLRNAAGALDNSYQYQNTMYILAAARSAFVSQLQTKYDRANLANNSDNLPTGLVVMTPDVGKTEAAVWFGNMQTVGYFEPGAEAMSAFLDVLETNRVSKNRLEWLLPPELIGQFIVGSGTIAFR